MKKEEYIIKNTVRLTKKYDERLSKYACKNEDCIKVKESHKEHDEFDIRWPYEEDIDRVLYCTAYQRYVDKTQALSFFNNAHVSKRSTHVQWVSRIGRQIGRGLNLNLDLIEAIALGHDLGHAPYGHVGEKALNEILQENGFGYFAHNANSVRDILFVERRGYGYNVSLQVLDGILCHNGEMLSKKYEPYYDKNVGEFFQEYEDCWKIENTSLKIRPMTLEGCVVRISDVISYIGKDIEDAIKVNIITRDEIPSDVVTIIGNNNKSIMNKLIGDLVIHSYSKPYLRFSDEVFSALTSLMNFLSEKVHKNPILVEENAKLERMIKELYPIYLSDLKNQNENSDIYQFVNKMNDNYKKNDNRIIVADYIAGMTDHYVLSEYERIFLPVERNELD